MLSVRGQLPDGSAGLQSDVPHWRPVAAFLQRWVQRDWRVGVQFCPERGYSVALLEILRDNALEEEKVRVRGCVNGEQV